MAEARGKLAPTSSSGAQRRISLRQKYDALQDTIDPNKRDSRLWKLANQGIYGCDANDRMACTSNGEATRAE